MEISIMQVEMSLNRLSSKNLVRKIYVQGRVGFELTPKGKQVIEALAKAETDRITRQLQEAIHEERKAKLRLSAVNKMKSIEDKWHSYQIPDRRLINEVEREATELLTETKELRDKQPLCQLDPQNYDQKFTQYKTQIEKLNEQNSNLTRAVDNYAKIKNYQLSILVDIESINKTINKYEPVQEATAQVNQLKNSICTLESIKFQLENFDKDQLTKFEEIKTQFGNNSKLLEILKKPTHEYTPIKRETSAETTTLYFDTEGPIKDGHKTSGYTLVEKCSKCGTKRKSTPVDIG
jgi:DNA repair exonuclease SbcCD ATPase subunit